LIRALTGIHVLPALVMEHSEAEGLTQRLIDAGYEIELSELESFRMCMVERLYTVNGDHMRFLAPKAAPTGCLYFLPSARVICRSWASASLRVSST
jgi:hypothetical protein